MQIIRKLIMSNLNESNNKNFNEIKHKSRTSSPKNVGKFKICEKERVKVDHFEEKYNVMENKEKVEVSDFSFNDNDEENSYNTKANTKENCVYLNDPSYHQSKPTLIKNLSSAFNINHIKLN